MTAFVIAAFVVGLLCATESDLAFLLALWAGFLLASGATG